MLLFNWNMPRFLDFVKNLKAVWTVPNITTAEICVFFVNLSFYLQFHCCVVQRTFSGEVFEIF